MIVEKEMFDWWKVVCIGLGIVILFFVIYCKKELIVESFRYYIYLNSIKC